MRLARFDLLAQGGTGDRSTAGAYPRNLEVAQLPSTGNNARQVRETFD